MKNKSLAAYINNAPKPKVRFIPIAPEKETKSDAKKDGAKNKKVAKKEKKAIKKAPSEQPILCKDSLSGINVILGELTEKVGNISQEYNDDLSTICSGIVESLNIYHLTVIEEMAKIDVNPVVDMSKLDVINDRLLNIIQTLAMRKPKEWDFEIERDMMGEVTNVKAIEVMH